MGIFKYNHKGTIYTKTTSTNAAGQRTSSFNSAGVIPFQFQSPSTDSAGGDVRRVAPYTDTIPIQELIVDAQYSDYFSYNNRVGDIQDKFNNSIDSNIYEIVAIQPKFNLTGKKHHIHVTLRKVVES
jgi:hypothetical protein